MIPLQEAARSVGWFAILVIVGIGVMLYLDFKKEKRDDNKQ